MGSNGMAKDQEVAILFADVVGSTQLYDRFGDTKASETVARCLEVMKDSTMQFNGTVIKTIGDEIMATFSSVDDAMGAATQMQNGISTSEADEDGIPVLGAKMWLESLSGHSVEPTMNSSHGSYFSAEPGRYRLHASYPGFKEAVMDVNLKVRDLRIDQVLRRSPQFIRLRSDR